MYIKPGNYENYLDYGKTMLSRAWGGAKNLLGNIDCGLQQAQRIQNIAAPLVSELAGDRAGSVKQKMDAAALQISRTRHAVGSARATHSRISDVASQIY